MPASPKCVENLPSLPFVIFASMYSFGAPGAYVPCETRGSFVVSWLPCWTIAPTMLCAPRPWLAGSRILRCTFCKSGCYCCWAVCLRARRNVARVSHVRARAHAAAVQSTRTFLPHYHMVQLPAVVPPPLQAGPRGRLLLGCLTRRRQQLLALQQRRPLVRHRREVDVVRRFRHVRLHAQWTHHTGHAHRNGTQPQTSARSELFS